MLIKTLNKFTVYIFVNSHPLYFCLVIVFRCFVSIIKRVTPINNMVSDGACVDFFFLGGGGVVQLKYSLNKTRCFFLLENNVILVSKKTQLGLLVLTKAQKGLSTKAIAFLYL